MIPQGLIRCEKCGEYNGSGTDKHGEFTVSCLCKGILCQRCMKNKIHRPMSNSYNEKTNIVGHWPYFSWMIPCFECADKARTEAEKKKEPMRPALLIPLSMPSEEAVRRIKEYFGIGKKQKISA